MIRGDILLQRKHLAAGRIIILLLLILWASYLPLIEMNTGPIVQVSATGSPPVLGVDCGLGTTTAVPYTSTPSGSPPPPVVGDGALDTTCTWTGDADAYGGATSDGTLEPLVSDKPETLASYGGGFTAEVRVTGMSGSPNGFDVKMMYDTKFLDAVLIDGKGLRFGDNATFGTTVFPLNVSINHAAGIVRVAEVLLNSPGVPGPDITLFRVRFDVLAVGTTQLSFFDSSLTVPSQSPPQVVPKLQPATFDSIAPFDPSGTLNWQVSITYSPIPVVPGTSLNLTAVAACPGCTGSLSYVWDTDSNGVSDATGRSVVITAPTSTLKVNRVTLNVTDAAGNIAQVFRRIPLAAAVSGPTTLAVSTSGTFSGLWLGGIPNYSGSWRLCPGSTSQTLVCSNPAPNIASTAVQINTQGVMYNFAGVYNDTVKINDTPAPQISTTPASTTGFLLVNVTGLPAAFTVTVTPSLSHPTVGSSINLTARVAYDATYPSTSGFRSANFKYSFSFGDSTTATVSDGTSVVLSKAYSTTGDFTVRVIAQDTSTASRIQETGWLTITVTPQITESFSFTPGASQTGQTVTFTATASGGTSPYTFTWDFGDGSTGTGSPATHSYTTAGTYTVKMTVTDSYGVSQSTTQTVTITAAPASNNSTLIYGGIAAALVAVAAAVLFLRRRRKTPKTTSAVKP